MGVAYKPKRGNCIQANSNECDRAVKTDFRLGEQGKLDKSELRPTGNCIEVGRHSTVKLIKMKTDKTESSKFKNSITKYKC